MTVALRMSNQDVTEELKSNSAWNRARKEFSFACARIEQAEAQAKKPTVFDIRRMEFDAITKIAHELGVKLAGDDEPFPKLGPKYGVGMKLDDGTYSFWEGPFATVAEALESSGRGPSSRIVKLAGGETKDKAIYKWSPNEFTWIKIVPKGPPKVLTKKAKQP